MPNGIEVVQVFWRRRFTAGYELRRERWRHAGDDTDITAAYNHAGDYIGSSKDAYFLCRRLGVTPQLRKAGLTVCSIGFSVVEQKWFGWSHRALFGFGVGHVVKKGSVIVSRQFPAGFRARTLADCKRMAARFAAEVG